MTSQPPIVLVETYFIQKKRIGCGIKHYITLSTHCIHPYIMLPCDNQLPCYELFSTIFKSNGNINHNQQILSFHAYSA